MYGMPFIPDSVCRSDETDKPKYYGRFNQGVVTCKPGGYRAVLAEGDMEKFWKIFDERLELCHRALMMPS